MMIAIQLNSFVHRVENKEQMIALAVASGCGLKRIRRSRHWRLSGNEQQLIELHDQLESDKNYWIKQAIEKALPKQERSLEAWLELEPNITVNKLLKETGCTVAQARHAIDKFEQLD